MSNLLHDFLHAANVQARPVMGELFNFRGQVGLTGFFTPTNAELAFKATGYLEEIDLVAVVDLDQFDAGNEPAFKAPLNYAGNLYSLRSIKTDLSSYTLGFKMIGPSAVPPDSGFSTGFSAGF
jgi:hypothetical protein